MSRIKEYLRKLLTRKKRDEKERADIYFEKLIDVLVAFENKHNVKLEKSHGDSYAFSFRNPKGGYCGIRIILISDGKLNIVTSWHTSDIEALIARNRIENIGPLLPDNGELKNILEESYRKALSWDQKDLNDIRNIQLGELSKEEHKKLNSELLESMPFPRP